MKEIDRTEAERLNGNTVVISVGIWVEKEYLVFVPNNRNRIQFLWTIHRQASIVQNNL